MRALCATTPSRVCVFGSSCLFLILHLFAQATAASFPSSLALGSSLSRNQSLRSANATFEFGFFPLPSSSSSLYLGIWYTNILPLTSVWVANRDKAVSQNATCIFDPNGSVNVLDGGKVVWSIGESASLLVLLETGNLVLLHSSNSSVVWQSFEHPGNTWLPNMLLGPGIKLQSWLTPDDPSSGHYTLMMGNSSNFVCVYDNYTQYWDSGYWDGDQFSNVPEMINHFYFSFSFNSSSGFEWEVDTSDENFKNSKFVIEYSGSITQSSYQVNQKAWSTFWEKPSNPCDVARMCGPNSICDNLQQPNCKCPGPGFQAVNKQEWASDIFAHGCERTSPLNCTSNHGTNDGFISVNQTTFEWSFFSSLAMADVQTCKDLCLANCSCNGLFFIGDGYGNCSLFSENLYDGTMSTSAMGTFYMRVSTKDLPFNNSSSRRNRKFSSLHIGLLVGSISILVIVSIAVFIVVRRWKRAASSYFEAGVKAFSYAELQAATKNFKNKLGSGGFGSVYEGVIGGLRLAVKKLNRLDESEKQFRAELRTLGTIQHINLVRLMGFCCEGKHRLLVYEMAQNGSLDAHLFGDDTRAAALTWHMRHCIALGAARGIAYLHQSCRECIIHCDIKPENILLDASYNVKVADFGLAKLMGREFSHVLTTLRGTRGYLAPEWIAGMPITCKADVYSFGMTLLELISGHRNVHNDPLTSSSTSNYTFFPLWAAQHVNKQPIDLASLLDTRIQGDVDMEQLTQMAYCAIWCIQDHEDLRPSMGEVVKVLEGNMLVSRPPIPELLEYLDKSESDISKFVSNVS